MLGQWDVFKSGQSYIRLAQICIQVVKVERWVESWSSKALRNVLTALNIHHVCCENEKFIPIEVFVFEHARKRPNLPQMCLN